MDDTAPELVFVAPSVGDDVVTTRDTQFHVDFNFSCDLFVCEYYDNVMLRRTVQRNVMRRWVRMDIKQLMKPECRRRMIDRELRDWPLGEDDRGDLSEFAINAAKDLIRDMPPQHNVLVIPFPVEIACYRIVDENRAEELMAGRSTEEAGRSTDCSVESLEIKTTTWCENNERCSICLEDFYVGCEVVSMPCSHFFHENCIKKWLKSSHSCPLCRFEIPTQT